VLRLRQIVENLVPRRERIDPDVHLGTALGVVVKARHREDGDLPTRMDSRHARTAHLADQRSLPLST